MTGILDGMATTNALFTEEVVAKGDLSALEHVYTTDARVLPPGADMVTGRAAIQQFWAGAINALRLERASLVTVDAMPAGDGIVEIGRAHLQTGSGDVTVKYVVFWKQEAGRWKWHVDIWNPNA